MIGLLFTCLCISVVSNIWLVLIYFSERGAKEYAEKELCELSGKRRDLSKLELYISERKVDLAEINEQLINLEQELKTLKAAQYEGKLKIYTEIAKEIYGNN